MNVIEDVWFEAGDLLEQCLRLEHHAENNTSKALVTAPAEPIDMRFGRSDQQWKPAINLASITESGEAAAQHPPDNSQLGAASGGRG
eukprot:SAG11_NODE_3026_length_2754_cov_2.113371_5_plen_87_part_00